VSDLVWLTLILAVLGGITVLGVRMEPHWSSKTGERFICRAQLLSPRHEPLGRWREIRGEVEGDEIVVKTRSLISRQIAGRWHVYARGTVDSRKRSVFLFRSDTTDNQLALRMPSNSNTIPLLEEHLPV
jgi:hypothetical protein